MSYNSSFISHHNMAEKYEPLPDFFGDPATYHAWRIEMVARLQIDGKKMGGEHDQIAAILDALKGPAETACRPFIEDLLREKAPQVSIYDVFEYMDEKYEDKNEKHEAVEKWNPLLDRNDISETELKVLLENADIEESVEEKHQALEQWCRLRQGTDSFDKYLGEFERLLERAGGQTFDEVLKMVFLRAGTSNKILYASVGERFDDMQAQAKRYRQIALDPATWKEDERAAPTTAAPTVGTGDAKGVNTSEPTPTRTRGCRGGRGKRVKPTQATTTRVNPNGGQGPGLPNDDLYRGHTAKRATAEDLARRRKANACFRCGRVGCSTAVCPLAAYKPAGPVKSDQTPDVATVTVTN